MDVRDRALNYLSARMCSCYRLKEYLRSKGYEDAEIDPVIEELKEYHYLDDHRYAMAYMESGFEKGRGIARIRSELRQRGVDPDVISRAENDLESVPDEFETALSIAEKVIEGTDIRRLEWKEKEALKARVARRLASRGFSSSTVYQVIGKLL